MKKRNRLSIIFRSYSTVQRASLKLPLKLEYRTTWCCGIEYMTLTKNRTILKANEEKNKIQ